MTNSISIPTARNTATVLLLAVALALGLTNFACAVTINWTTIGDAGNFDGPETNGRTFGGVSYEYSIGTYEVTNSQYAEFLNAKDPTGANALSLYNANMTSQGSGGIAFDSLAADGAKYSVKVNQGNQPVNYVSWFDSVRFTNWLNNGQGNADTETGAYTLLGGTATPSNARTIVRNEGASIVLPSEDEWYKAAFYDPTMPGGPGYWLFPARSNDIPISASPSNTPNTANYRDNGFALTPGVGTGGIDVLPTFDYLTNVGAYTASSSYYGTFDQGGNVIEWNEQILMPQNTNPAGVRGVMGGAFFNDNSFMNSLGWAASTASVQNVGMGFRVVSLVPVPEPASLVLALSAIAAIGIGGLRARRRSDVEITSQATKQS